MNYTTPTSEKPRSSSKHHQRAPSFSVYATRLAQAILIAYILRVPSLLAQQTAVNDNAPPTGSRARTFVELTQNRPPRENLTRALEMFAEEFAVAQEDGPLRAADLGAGAGNESLHLMKQGWHVLAIDAEPFSAETIAKYAQQLRDSGADGLGSIEPIHTKMQDMQLPADSLQLINASFSLPFVPQDEIDAVWRQCVVALQPGGIFTGHFFGPDHEWHENPKMSFFSVKEAFERFVNEYPLELRYLMHDKQEVNLAVGGTAFFDTITVVLQKTDG